MSPKSPLTLNAVVLNKQELSPRYMILRITSEGWALPSFIPGQFSVLGLHCSAPRCALAPDEPYPPRPDEFIRRAYSVASSSRIDEYLEFYIGLVSSGALTPRLFALNIGDRLWLSPRVAGMFTLDQVPEGKHVVLIATGTGLAPYMSMLTTQLSCGTNRRFAVLHGAYHSWDLAYRSELLSLQGLCSNLTYLATIDRPEEEPSPWRGHTGWVQDLWTKSVLAEAWGFKPTPQNTAVFLCGNPLMIDSMLDLLGQEGYCEYDRRTGGEVHIERY